MKVLIAMDSFKGSLSSLAAGEAIRAGLLRAMPKADAVVCPLADGGEGTAEALTAGLRGEMVSVEVTGPLGAPVVCRYGVAGSLAIVEMAGAAGLPQVPAEKRDPMATTTFGVGEVIRDAIARGCRRFVIGLGGSATNDGGAGMLQALGFDLLDEYGAPIPRGAAGLARLRTIAAGRVLPELRNCTFRAACDVENPLCGPLGCSAVFGPQKGAKAADIPKMDAWLRGFAALAKTVFPESDADFPGSGAAGGMGFALRTFLGASLEPGVSIVLEETGLAEKIRAADMVVTGEGRLDAQTAMGKAPAGVARLAKRYGKPVVAFAGGIADGAQACHAAGIDAFFPAVRGVTTLEEAMRPETAAENLAAAAEQTFRLVAAAGTARCEVAGGARVNTRSAKRRKLVAWSRRRARPAAESRGARAGTRSVRRRKSVKWSRRRARPAAESRGARVNTRSAKRRKLVAWSRQWMRFGVKLRREDCAGKEGMCDARHLESVARVRQVQRGLRALLHVFSGRPAR